MKIDHNSNISKLTQSTQQKQVEPGDAGQSKEPSRSGDTSKVSTLAHQIAEAKRAADELPEIRTDKIALAKKRLDEGYYDTPEAREVLVSKLAALVKETS